MLLAIENPTLFCNRILHSLNLEDHKEKETGLLGGLFIFPSGLDTSLVYTSCSCLLKDIEGQSQRFVLSFGVERPLVPSSSIGNFHHIH